MEDKEFFKRLEEEKYEADKILRYIYEQEEEELDPNRLKLGTDSR